MSKTKTKSSFDLETDRVLELDEPEFWDITDQADQHFWEEFFHFEELIEVADELDSPEFSVTIQNHQTGEVKTFERIHLKSARRKIIC